MSKQLITYLAISLVLLNTLIPSTDALQCYVCVACGNTGTSGTLTTCTSGFTSCSKYVVSVLSVQTITKSCSASCVASSSGSLLGTGAETYCCTTDGCNYSNKMVSGLISLFSTLVALCYAKLKF